MEIILWGVIMTSVAISHYCLYQLGKHKGKIELHEQREDFNNEVMRVAENCPEEYRTYH